MGCNQQLNNLQKKYAYGFCLEMVKPVVLEKLVNLRNIMMITTY